MERDFIWDDGRMVQHADDVLLSCTLETCMVLQINFTPINSIKKIKGSQVPTQTYLIRICILMSSSGNLCQLVYITPWAYLKPRSPHEAVLPPS